MKFRVCTKDKLIYVDSLFMNEDEINVENSTNYSFYTRKINKNTAPIILTFSQKEKLEKRRFLYSMQYCFFEIDKEFSYVKTEGVNAIFKYKGKEKKESDKK